MRTRFAHSIFLALAVFTVLFIVFFVASRGASLSPPKDPSASSDIHRVLRVIDGDTIEIDTGERVRYIGIDTPESVTPGSPVECFGKEASQRNKELVEGATVRLVRDVSDTDKYGRLLRYVYLNDTLVNETLVHEGYAYMLTVPPDIALADRFREAQRNARDARRGLWGACGDTIENAGQSSTGTNLIKGNINQTGDKIYHLPECEYYEKTSIDEARGERWFATEDEARAAGWRKADNCPQ